MQIQLGRYDLRKYSAGSKILMMWLLNVVFLTVARFLLTRVDVYGWPRELILNAITLIPIVLLLKNLPAINRKNCYPFLVLYAAVILAFAVTYLLHPEYEYFYVRENYGLQRVFRPDCALYAFLFFSLVDDPDELTDTVKLFAFIDFAYLLVFELLPALLQGYWSDVNYVGETVKRQYSLSFGYAMLFPTIVFMYCFFREKKRYYMLLSLLGLVLILLQGSRGAILMPIIFIGLMAISDIVDTKSKVRRKRKIVFILCIAAAILILGIPLLKLLVKILQLFGVESRTLELLASGKFTGDSGRSVIWNSVWEAIKSGGLLGYGAFGDRPFVYPHHFVGYSHNIVLELICSFGIVGVLIVLVIIAVSLRVIFCCRDARWRGLFIVFFSIASQLLLSLSFWYVWEFWAAAAIAYNSMRPRKRKRLQQNGGRN